jgi:RNA-directed DNA polymerase
VQFEITVPTVRDRIVQTALRLVVEPIFEVGFAPHSYGFRPQRGAKDALRRVAALLRAGYHHVVDADLQAYFGAPGQAGRFQRVQFPPRQGERAAPPGIEPWAHGGNDMG